MLARLSTPECRVYRGEARPDAFALVKRAFDLPGLEPHPYSEQEYRGAAETVDRMTEGGVVLSLGAASAGRPHDRHGTAIGPA